MKGTPHPIAYLLPLGALLLTLGCAAPAPEPEPTEEGGAITTEDFESGGVDSMQQGPSEDEEGRAEPQDEPQD